MRSMEARQNSFGGCSCLVAYLALSLTVVGAIRAWRFIERLSAARAAPQETTAQDVGKDPGLQSMGLAYLAKLRLRAEALDRNTSRLFQNLGRLESANPAEVVVAEDRTFTVAGLEVDRIRALLQRNCAEAAQISQDAEKTLSDAGLQCDPACLSALEDLRQALASSLAIATRADPQDEVDPHPDQPCVTDQQGQQNRNSGEKKDEGLDRDLRDVGIAPEAFRSTDQEEPTHANEQVSGN